MVNYCSVEVDLWVSINFASVYNIKNCILGVFLASLHFVLRARSISTDTTIVSRILSFEKFTSYYKKLKQHKKVMQLILNITAVVKHFSSISKRIKRKQLRTSCASYR